MPKDSTSGSSSIQRSNLRATGTSEVPWTSSESSAMQNTMLNISVPPSTPLSTVHMAKRMGPAPFMPAQEIYVRARNDGRRNGSRLRKTPSGRPTKMMNTPSNRAGSITAGMCVGRASRPRSRNISNWASQVMLSKNFSTSFLKGKSFMLPMMMAATYSAISPLPPTIEARPLASRASVRIRME